MYDKYGNPPRRSRDRYEVANFEVNAKLVKFIDPTDKSDAKDTDSQPELLEYPKGDE
jgi:hypothetical protein